MTCPVIRQAAENDLPALLALYRQLNPGDPSPSAEAAEDAWAMLRDSPLVTVFVAEEAGRLISSCMLTITPNLTRGARPFAVIENVVTDAAHRRRGLGRGVLHAALEAAWAARCYKVMLATGSTRPETLRFYEGAGFRRGGKTLFEARR